MSALPHQTALPLAPRPRERTLEFVVLSALGDPGVVPCPICRGRMQEVGGGVACEQCGCEILRGFEDDDADQQNVVSIGRADG
jgi:hypothetical protein